MKRATAVSRIAFVAGLCFSLVAPLVHSATDSTPRRHALVVGNSRYLDAPLVNPANDARAIADRLKQAGFQVTLKLDAGRQEFNDALRTFANDIARDKGVGLFYYAGHGVQLNWRNFLVPVDARIRSKADIQAQSVDLGVLIDGMTRARNALNIVILDACRNNPLGADFRIDDRGLTQIDAPPGTLLAYATAPGNVAADGAGSHGLYTDNLLREMQVPGAAVEDVLKRVRLAVRRGSQGAQIPWESTSLEGEFSFFSGGPRRDPDTLAKEFDSDLAAWQQLRNATSTEHLEAFLRQRPSGKFSELAQFRLDSLLRDKGENPVRSRASAPEVCTPDGTPAAPYALPAQPYRVGEKYSYRSINMLTQVETGRFSDTVLKIAGDEVEFNDGRKVTDLFGNIMRAPDGRKWTPYQFFINDYQLGKRWPAQFIVTLPDQKKLSMTFDLRVAARERITVGAGTFDAFRIEVRGANLSNGAVLERTAWVAPERMRGFIALESVTRKDGKILDGERIELSEFFAPQSAAQPAPTPPAADKKRESGMDSGYSRSGG